MLFSSQTCGFYDPKIHAAAAIPPDAVELSIEQYDMLLAGQANGLKIVGGASGRPILVEQPKAAPVIPATVSRFQARAALHQAGLLADAEAAIAAADLIAQIAWADAAEWRRNSPTIATLAATLGLTDEQVDQLFITAAQISA